MLVFSYFFFYEYSIISRNYAISILFMIIFCILYKDKYKNLISISIVLFFMGLGNLYSFIISIIFFLFLFFDILTERHRSKNSLNKIHALIVLLIMTASILLFYWQLGSQLKGTTVAPSMSSLIRNISFGKLLNILTITPKSIIKSYFPIPNFNLNFWETNIITSFLSNISVILIYLLGAILFLIPLFFLKKSFIYIYNSQFINPYNTSFYLGRLIKTYWASLHYTYSLYMDFKFKKRRKSLNSTVWKL